MWWSFSSTTTNISALSNPMFLGEVSDAHTNLCISLCAARARASLSLSSPLSLSLSLSLHLSVLELLA
jgi:hypothetical protein